MKRRQAANESRRGLSLLEMMVATAMMATLMTSVVVVVRSGYTVWNAHENDLDVLENAYGVLRHFVREMRQANSVTSITAANDTSGSLSFITANGVTRTWSHNGAQQVYYDNGVNDHLLATGIGEYSFTGYEADGVTPTTTAADIQVVKCTVEVTLPAGQTRTVSTRAWIRSW